MRARLTSLFGQEVEDPEEENFYLYSQRSPNGQNLGFIDPKSDNVLISIGTRKIHITQSVSGLHSSREGGTTGSVLWKVTQNLSQWLLSSDCNLFTQTEPKSSVNSRLLTRSHAIGSSRLIGRTAGTSKTHKPDKDREPKNSHSKADLSQSELIVAKLSDNPHPSSCLRGCEVRIGDDRKGCVSARCRHAVNGPASPIPYSTVKSEVALETGDSSNPRILPSLDKCHIFELGAGAAGLLAITLGSKACAYYATDQQYVLDLLRFNLSENLGDPPHASQLAAQDPPAEDEPLSRRVRQGGKRRGLKDGLDNRELNKPRNNGQNERDPKETADNLQEQKESEIHYPCLCDTPPRPCAPQSLCPDENAGSADKSREEIVGEANIKETEKGINELSLLTELRVCSDSCSTNPFEEFPEVFLPPVGQAGNVHVAELDWETPGASLKVINLVRHNRRECCTRSRAEDEARKSRCKSKAGRRREKRTLGKPTEELSELVDSQTDQKPLAPTPDASSSTLDQPILDLIIGSDCIYNESLIDPFIETCVSLCEWSAPPCPRCGGVLKANNGVGTRGERVGESDTRIGPLVLVAQHLRDPGVMESWLRAFTSRFHVWRVSDEWVNDEVDLGPGSGYVVHLGVLR